MSVSRVFSIWFPGFPPIFHLDYLPFIFIVSSYLFFCLFLAASIPFPLRSRLPFVYCLSTRFSTSCNLVYL